MATINPWNEVFFNVNGVLVLQYDWQAGKEYKIFVSDNRGEKEMAVAHMSIIEDVPAPTSGISGVRAPAGWDIGIAAQVFPGGNKYFRPYWGDGNVDDRIYKVMERDIVPDGNVYNLEDGDDTLEFTEILNTSARSGTIPQFDRDYEFIFWTYAPQSSAETYYSTATFMNLAEMYNRYSNTFVHRMVLYWYYRDWWRLNDKTNSPTFDIRGGTSAHRLRKVFRRRIERNYRMGYYNTVSVVVDHGKKDNLYRNLDDNLEYIFGVVDNPGTNELVYPQLMVDRRLNPAIPTSSRGFMVRGGRDCKILYNARSARLIYQESDGYIIYMRERVEEAPEVEPPPDPDPEPDPDPPPPTIDCKDICVALGDDYVTEANVEVNFIDPPDWQLRRYEYEWSTPSPELNVVDTEAGGRIAIVRLTHTMTETDDGALLPYDISVTVNDLDYNVAGVSDSDSAILTFEMPCLVVNSPTVFSVDDVTVPECGAGDANTTAVFTISADAPVEGEPRTVNYEVVGITASIDTTITVLASDSNDLPFLMVRETPTTKLYLDGSFTRFWNQNAGDNGPTDIMVQLLANIPPWASDGRNNNILIIEDVEPNAYKASATGTGGFATTFDVAFNQVLGAPWTYTVMTTGEVENEDQAFYEGYALVIYLSTTHAEGAASELSPTHSLIQHLPDAARAGVGVAILADHDVFYFNANKILAEIDPSLQFAGGAGINRTGEVITVADSIAKHGTHPLLDGLSGQFPVASSEAYIPAVTSNPDFVYTSGQVTFIEGDTSKQVNITVLCDDILEENETFKLVISNPSIGSIGKAEGIGTIVDSTPDVTTVELAQAGESYEVYIYRDISGSMTGANMGLNGNTNATRDNIAVQVLNDFQIPSANVAAAAGASVSFFTSYVRWVLDNLPANQDRVSILFITDAEDGYGSAAPNLVTYTSASNNHPAIETHGTLVGGQTAASPAATAVPATDGSTWNSTIGALPAQIVDMKITVVRLLPQDRIDAANQSRIDGTPNNTAIAEDGFLGILNSAPATVTQASFETFPEYNTGEDSVLNDRISAAVLATWDAYCSRTPDTKIQVQAANQTEAENKAKPLLNCADD